MDDGVAEVTAERDQGTLACLDAFPRLLDALEAAERERDNFRDGMVAMLVAAGAPESIDEMGSVVSKAGSKPSDFVRMRIRALTAERDAAKQDAIELRYVLRRANFSPCDVPACNCGSWHERTTGDGFYARFLEIDEAIGSHDGMTTLQAVKLLVAEREAISKAHREVINERDDALAELAACKARLAALVESVERIRDLMGGANGTEGWESPEDVWGIADAALAAAKETP